MNNLLKEISKSKSKKKKETMTITIINRYRNSNVNKCEQPRETEIFFDIILFD